MKCQMSKKQKTWWRKLRTREMRDEKKKKG